MVCHLTVAVIYSVEPVRGVLKLLRVRARREVVVVVAPHLLLLTFYIFRRLLLNQMHVQKDTP